VSPHFLSSISQVGGGSLASIRADCIRFLCSDAMFNQLQEQSNRVASLGPTADSAAQIQTMRRRVRAQDRKQEVRIDEVKRIVREVLKDQIAESMRCACSFCTSLS